MKAPVCGLLHGDTGTRLILAKHRLAAGDAGQAATLLERVLESPTTVYGRRFGAH